MQKSESYLVVMDVPQIKEYVFGTDRLVEIRGASALLDHLNRSETQKFLEQETRLTEVECIFSNGGAGQFLLHGSNGAVTDAIEALKGLYFERSKGKLRLVCGKAEYDGANYAEARERAFLRMREEKEAEPIVPVGSFHTGYIRECESCSGMGYKLNKYGGEARILCEACLEKVDRGKERGLWTELAQHLAKVKGVEEETALGARPSDFKKIGECCKAKKDFTALVYADGNSMGRLIKAINDKAKFELFSKVVDESIRQACHEAIAGNETFSDTAGDFGRKGTLPIDILLLGGDDLLVYTTAEAALPFAISAGRKFWKKTQARFSEDPYFRDLLGGKGLTISFGIAYGKSHTPFSIMLDQAEELLKSAKSAGSKDTEADSGTYFAPAYIDYHLASYFNQVRVDDCRRNHLQIRGKEQLFLYRKPYSLDDADALLKCATDLVSKRIPRSRLKRFGFAPSLGKTNAMIEFLRLFVGTRKHQHRQTIWEALDRFGCAGEMMPWKKSDSGLTTILVDLIELTEFAREEGSRPH